MSLLDSTPAPAHTEVRVDPARSRRWGAWYVAEHKLRALKSFGPSLFATALGTPLLYLFAFGVGLGALITDNIGPEGSGVSYLTFVAPALVCSAAVMIAAEEFLFTFMMGLKWNPIFVGMNAAPMSGAQIAAGCFISSGVRMLLSSVLYFLVMLVFGAVPFATGVLVIPIAVLTGFAFSLLAAYSASIRDDRGQFAIINRVLVLPLTLFSGTVFPLSQLPIFLQWIGWLSPLWHGSELARVAAYGLDDPLWLTAVHVLYLAALGVVGTVLCARIVRKRLDV